MELAKKNDNRWKLFAALYVGRCRMNGTEAAHEAGYAGSREALAVRASELLSEPKVKAEITAYLDRVQTDGDEVLAAWKAGLVKGVPPPPPPQLPPAAPAALSGAPPPRSASASTGSPPPPGRRY